MTNQTTNQRVSISAEGSELLSELFNRVPIETLKSIPEPIRERISKFMTDNGYRFVFNRWFLQADPKRANETNSELCPNCEKDEVGTFAADDSFLYGTKNPVRLIAKDVLFFRCMACGLEYTGEDGENKRLEAIRAHLATKSPMETSENLRSQPGATMDTAGPCTVPDYGEMQWGSSEKASGESYINPHPGGFEE